MDKFLQWSAIALVAAAFGVAAIADSAGVAERDDTHVLQALHAAVAAAEQTRMAHVSTIVTTDRRIALAEAAQSPADVAALTAASEREQLTYQQLVHLELALRSELALVEASARR